MIVPMAIVADVTSREARVFVFRNSRRTALACFPQKDNPNRRVFRNAKLSTVIITLEKSAPPDDNNAQIFLETYPFNSFLDQPRTCTFSLAELALIDHKNVPVPMCSQQEWKLCLKIHSGTDVEAARMIKEIDVRRGEINQTIYRKFIKPNPRMSRLLKGVEVGRFHLNKKLSQGEKEWLDESAFLKENVKPEEVDTRRIATQRITGVDERNRIVCEIIEPPTYFADSTNSIRSVGNSEFELEYLTALLNSHLFQWRFKLTSSNNNVGTNELEALPMRRIPKHKTVESRIHASLKQLVSSMRNGLAKLDLAKSAHDRKLIEREIERTDREIDRLVYELYGLTEAEIKIVEDATK